MRKDRRLWIRDNREAEGWEKWKTEITPMFMAWLSAQIVEPFTESGNTGGRTGFREC